MRLFASIPIPSFVRRRESSACLGAGATRRAGWIPAVAGMARRSLRGPVAALAFGLAVSAAHADVWGYVDARGVAHFASERLDERYQLFFRGGERFDTAEGVAALQATPRPVAVPTRSAARLIAFFEVSPGFKRVQHHLREAASTHGIDVELLKALIATESGFDPAAVSPRGAVGLMQVLPSTAQRYGVTADRRQSVEKKLADPRTNIRAGARYLRYLLDLFPGQLELALAAYNAGEGAVQRAGNRIPNYRETRHYVQTVLQLYAMLKPPALAARERSVPHRVRVELPAPPGGAAGRGNMPPPLAGRPPELAASGTD